MTLDHICTQGQFADAVGIGQPAVSKLISEGVLPEAGTFGDWLRAYCGRLREQAAGRYSEGDLDLAQERAALARAQREGIEIKNAVLRGQYAPIQLLAEVLAQASSAVAERFDHLPGTLKKTCPDMTDRQRAEVLAVIASARNEWVRQTAALVAAGFDVAPPDDDDLADGAEDAEGPAA